MLRQPASNVVRATAPSLSSTLTRHHSFYTSCPVEQNKMGGLTGGARLSQPGGAWEAEVG